MTIRRRYVNKNGLFKRKRLLVIFSAFLFFVVIWTVLIIGKTDRNVYIIMRYDDYASGSSSLIEEELIHLIRKNDYSCSFGIIPFEIDTSISDSMRIIPLTDYKVNLIIDEVRNGFIEVCQHGYLHQNFNKNQPNSEFKGMDQAHQLRKISTGKAFLERKFETKISTFIPPWNSYDFITLSTLQSLDFTNLSADQVKNITDNCNLNLLPFTAYITDIKKLVNCKILPGMQNPIILNLMLHDYDFREVNPNRGIIDLNEFSDIMGEIVKRNWQIISINNANKVFGIFNVESFRLNKMKLYFLDHLNPFLKYFPGSSKINMLSIFYLNKLTVTLLFFLMLIYYIILILIVAELLHNTLSKWLILKKHRNLVRGSLLFVALAASLALYFDDHRIGHTEAYFLIALYGFVLSTFYYPNEESFENLID